MTREKNYGIAIHGGAGTILKAKMTPEKESAYRAKLAESLDVGSTILQSGGAALDAVQKAVNVMENSPLFNAGKGAVFTSDGMNEQDAMIMDGPTLNYGAVAALRRIKNPIDLARMVMEKSDHVFLAADGAEAFAVGQGMELVDQDYFFTELRWGQLQKAREREESFLDHSDDKPHGTVGAVALDREGNLAAATSTGGMTNKKFGRVGDTPIIGAGTYANNHVAVSATGHGEYIMRAMMAYDIAALVEYKQMTLADATELVVMRKFADIGGTGGVVAIDSHGNVAMPFNTPGMYHGCMLGDSDPVIGIFKD